MDRTDTFHAPWSRLLKLATALALVVCVGIIGIGLTVFPPTRPIERWTMMLLPMSVVICTAPFMVRGYSLADGNLIIHRLGWDSHLALSSLQSAKADPTAMKGSFRVFGNGGLFAFCGIFRNHNLGNYRAFATDPERSVVLRFSDRTVVVTPDAPDKFASEINRFVASGPANRPG